MKTKIFLMTSWRKSVHTNRVYIWLENFPQPFSNFPFTEKMFTIRYDENAYVCVALVCVMKRWALYNSIFSNFQCSVIIHILEIYTIQKYCLLFSTTKYMCVYVYITHRLIQQKRNVLILLTVSKYNTKLCRQHILEYTQKHTGNDVIVKLFLSF